ncbi:hypothetical protein N431DRAFT_466006 [Stipitochalara longipes BDJ]|nr:hypothetical protein N431DRAFT_466006 [Stipitochalara longipes BDJ]
MNTLPSETLQRIASFSSCESVLALVRVSRHFYKTCYDKAVFKAVIRNQNGCGGKPWNCAFITAITSTSDLARLALADFRGRTWLDDTEVERDGSEEKEAENKEQESDENEARAEEQERQNPSFQFDETQALNLLPNGPRGDPLLRWAPQLVALHHPFLVEEGRTLEEVVEKFEHERAFDWGDPHVLDFCVTSTTLYHCTTALHPSTSLGKTGFDILEHCRQRLEPTHSVAPSPALLICSLFIQAHRLLNADVSLPKPNKIPFREIFGMPVPFSSTAFSASSHLPVMTSASFLQSGEWVGYYNCTLNLKRARWDPPMKGIRFIADPDAGPYAWKASGIDNVAPFTLAGSISPNGNVVMRKDYPGFYWNWNVSIAPFGIVGTWGQGNIPHGQVWLWKREWC